MERVSVWSCSAAQLLSADRFHGEEKARTSFPLLETWSAGYRRSMNNDTRKDSGRGSLRDADCPSWMKICAAQVCMFGSMLRRAEPIPDPTSVPPAANVLLELFQLDGAPPPESLASLLNNGLSALPALVERLGGIGRKAASMWIERRRIDLEATAQSLVTFYTQQRGERIHGLPQPRSQLCDFKIRSLFEETFCSWLEEERPLVLERAVALMGGIFFATFTTPEARRRVTSLIADVRTLQQVSSRLSATLASLENKHVLGVNALDSAVSGVLEALAPYVDILKTKGRPSDPFGSVVVRCLRDAGLTVGDVAQVMGVTPNAVRKNRRRAGLPHQLKSLSH
jgi:hypothetical protein